MCTAALMALSSVGETVSSYQSTNAQADIADRNAQLVSNKIADVEYQKQQKQKEIKQQKQQVKGSQMASMAASGVDSSYGTGLSAIADTNYTAQQDINETEYNAAKQEYGYNVEAANYRNQANATRQSAKSGLIGGLLGTAGQYYSGLSTTNKKWNAQKYNGMGDFKSANRY